MKSARVAITGIGIISSLGSKAKEIISSIQEDSVGFQVSEINSHVFVCPISWFDFKDYIPRYKYARYLPRSWKFSLCAAKKAIEQSNLSQADLGKTGLFVGSGPNVEGIYLDPSKKALGILEILPNTPSFCISHFLGVHGENLTISTACSSSLQAIGEGFLRIRSGQLKIALCGGGDSRLGRAGTLLYHRAGVLLTRQKNTCAKQVYAPFDIQNSGFVPGEGGAFLVLEEMEHAIKRKAEIFGEVLGYSSSLDGTNPTAPGRGSSYSSQCVKRSLEMSKLDSSEIDIIFSHGTGTVLNDEMEINLIKRIFPINKPYICALKSWIGHLAAGCGAVEMAVGIICMKNGLIPKIRNLKDPRDRELNFLISNTKAHLKNAVFQSFGFGGQNAAVVIRT